MATWPESSPSPIYPLDIKVDTMTSIVDLGGGVKLEQRRAEWLYPAFSATVRYKALTATEMQTLWNFFIARKGPYEAFWLYDLGLLAGIAPAHVGQYVATADGVLDTFDLPGRNTSARTMYVDGAEESSVSYAVGGGEASADRVTFTGGAPTAGAIIRADFTGYLRMSVRFAQDYMTKDLFVNSYYFNDRAIEFVGVSA
jgi:uncharacterized protein (TIGR02217 family)